MNNIVKQDVLEIKKKLSNLKDKIEGKKFLITGGAGFIGSWFCDILSKFDTKITCLDNFSTSSVSNIQHLLDNKKIKLIEGDVSSSNIDEKFDYILHMASRAEPKDYPHHPLNTISANSLGTLNMLELARKSDVKTILFASTSEIYGDPEITPIPEAYFGNVSSTGIRSCYDESKRFGETLCMAFFREYGLPVIIARIFNTYGPRLRGGAYGRAVSTFIEQCLANKPMTVFGDGQQTRSFCYITDQIECLLKLLLSNIFGDVFNTGNDKEIKIIDLANLIKRLTGSKSEVVFEPLPEGDPRRRCPDLSKVKKTLNYTPKVSLEEGLTKTIDWFKSIRSTS